MGVFTLDHAEFLLSDLAGSALYFASSASTRVLQSHVLLMVVGFRLSFLRPRRALDEFLYYI